MFIVGADKGGVGKTFFARLLHDYLQRNNISTRVFDAEWPDGGLKRFIPSAEIVDLTKSNGQMAVIDGVNPEVPTIVDLRAALLTPTLQLFEDTGLFDDAKRGYLRLVVCHVIGASAQSLGEVDKIISKLEGAKHLIIANNSNAQQINSASPHIQITELDEAAAVAVDQSALGFTSFIESSQSRLLRGKVAHWLRLSYEQLDAPKLVAAIRED
jgi:hypothetical protein